MVDADSSGPVQRQASCTHHWQIARPSGETSTGVCRLCGASREFHNYGYRTFSGPPRKPNRDNRTSG